MNEPRRALARLTVLVATVALRTLQARTSTYLLAKADKELTLVRCENGRKTAFVRLRLLTG
jgi:hypothetical protein